MREFKNESSLVLFVLALAVVFTMPFIMLYNTLKPAINYARYIYKETAYVFAVLWFLVTLPFILVRDYVFGSHSWAPKGWVKY